MENWQRLGTYTAGLALEDAGLKDNEDLVSTMDLVVAAGGGERDIAVDDSIMKDALQRNDRERLLNERLPNDLRPTLFLAQLSNLMAGNISIVHRVTGSSRTYMGEESAGITAIENAMRRIEAGQSTHALVGGAFNAERPDLLLSLELGHYIWRGEPLPVAARQASGGGSITGSAGAFLVLEEAGHARARGARPYARLSNVASDLGPRDAAQTRERLESMLGRIHAPAGSAVVSGATGCAEITDLEFDVLRARLGKDVAVRAITTMIGNPVEANFPAGIALAALALYHGGMFPPFEAAEKPFSGKPESVVVSAVGHYRGEGFGLLEKI
jgi:3-oxoacyl-[acyl-carrier-protein] synthase II